MELERELEGWVNNLQSAVAGEDASAWKLDASVSVTCTVAAFSVTLAMFQSDTYSSIVARLTNLPEATQPVVAMFVEREQSDSLVGTAVGKKGGEFEWKAVTCELCGFLLSHLVSVQLSCLLLSPLKSKRSLLSVYVFEKSTAGKCLVQVQIPLYSFKNKKKDALQSFELSAASAVPCTLVLLYHFRCNIACLR